MLSFNDYIKICSKEQKKRDNSLKEKIRVSNIENKRRILKIKEKNLKAFEYFFNNLENILKDINHFKTSNLDSKNKSDGSSITFYIKENDDNDFYQHVYHISVYYNTFYFREFDTNDKLIVDYTEDLANNIFEYYIDKFIKFLLCKHSISQPIKTYKRARAFLWYINYLYNNMK